ncbi:hypothetical protein XENTR_v10014700 [Xenopus tropicalis]|nr:hypothetical protein XENTR_v10014700 [Xenopus tropicalis]
MNLYYNSFPACTPCTIAQCKGEFSVSIKSFVMPLFLMNIHNDTLLIGFHSILQLHQQSLHLHLKLQENPLFRHP